jgi:hypothetical protein
LITHMGKRHASPRHYERALALNPRDPTLQALTSEPK